MTAVLVEICSDSSTTKLKKLLSSVETIVKRIPGVYRVLVEVYDNSSKVDRELLYTNRSEGEDMGALLSSSSSSSTYTIDCFEISGAITVCSTKHVTELDALDKLFVKSESEVMRAVVVGVGRRVFELRRGRKNKVLAAQAIGI